MLLISLLVIAISASRSAALPRLVGGGEDGGRSTEDSGGHEFDGGGSHVGRSLSGFHTRAVLSGPSGALRPELGYKIRSSSDSADKSARRRDESIAGDGSPVNNDTRFSKNSTILCSIANITVHQYPQLLASLNDTSLPAIFEDVFLWIYDLDNGRANAATAAQCNLTWNASATSSSHHSSKQQMKCVTRGVDGRVQDIPNYTPKYNVTFEQQTESPLSGFDVHVSSSARGSAVWAPRSLASDDAWQINENYFQHPGFVLFGRASVPQKRASQSIHIVHDHQSKASNPSNTPPVTSTLTNSRRSAQDDTSVQSVVAGIINSTLATAAIHVSSATFNTPSNQIAISELINSTLIDSALNIGSETGDPSNSASDTFNNHQSTVTTDPVNNSSNNTIIDAAIEAASTLFNIPKSNIKFVNITTAGAAMNSSSHLQTAHIMLNTTVNAAVNAASTLFNIPKNQIKVVGASDGSSVTTEAAKPPSQASKTPNDKIKAAAFKNSTIASAAVKVSSASVP